MKNKLFFCLIIVPLFILSGCTSISEAGYYWGNYSSTLYAYEQAPSAESLEAHLNELMDIVEYSNANSLKIPPGINAEIGYFLEKQGNSSPETILQYYQYEIELYPESQVFLERLTSEAQ